MGWIGGELPRLGQRVDRDDFPALVEHAEQAGLPAHPDLAADILGRHGVVGLGHLDVAIAMLHYYLRDATPIWIDVVYGLAPLIWLNPRLGARPGRHEPAAIAVGHNEQGAERHRVAGAVVEQAGR